MTESFRNQLRVETRAAHEALDALISNLDVATHDGLAAFCQIHLTCFGEMARIPHLDPATDQLLRRVNRALADDLATLGRPAARLACQLSRTTAPLATAYVVGGSRLGSKILKSRWAASRDAGVQAAHHYFALPGEGPYWKAVCADLDRIIPDTAAAAKIVADTISIFDMFGDACQQITRQEVLGDAL